MSLTIEDVAALPLDVIRSALPEWACAHVRLPPEATESLRHALGSRVAVAGDAELEAMRRAFVEAGEGYRFYPAAPFARDMTRIFMAALTEQWRIDGAEHLDRFLAEGPRRRLIVCNHLSYTDTQVTDVVLARAGRAELAGRLVAVAGPKVYTTAWRRMAAVSLNTRKTAQSNAVATEQGALGARELAAVAFETIRDCERLMDEGWIVLLYPEGTRSRTGRLQPFLRASARYLSVPDLQVLVLAQTGTEDVYPIDSPVMYPRPVRLAFGEPFVAAAYPGKTGPSEEAWRRLAVALPETHRPEAGTAAVRQAGVA